MHTEYVKKCDDGYRVAGTRVSLDSVVHAYWNGQSAESIAQSFSALTLEQIHGALAYYLAHQREVDALLKRAEAEYDVLRAASRMQDPMFYQKLADARRARQTAPS